MLRWQFGTPRTSARRTHVVLSACAAADEGGEPDEGRVRDAEAQFARYAKVLAITWWPHLAGWAHPDRGRLHRGGVPDEHSARA